MPRIKFQAHRHVPTIKKKREDQRPGEPLQREPARYRDSRGPIIPKARFYRLVRELTQWVTPPGARKIYEAMWYEGYRYEPLALKALQAATEDYLVELLQDCNDAAAHAGRVTIMPSDLILVRKIRRDLPRR
ncbi:hypothetical protein CF319_g9312 [Tilletia indica]|nr:hypothetical protein CF319_g9312 [Tilletia indica]